MSVTDVSHRHHVAAPFAAKFAAEPKGRPLMRVFVTGASGWIGSAAVDELLAAGHEVTGLARADASAAALAAKGGSVRPGTLPLRARARAGARAAEPVLHRANNHHGPNPANPAAAARAAVQTIGDA